MKPAGLDQPVLPGGVAVLGVPFDANSSFLRGPALAFVKVRSALGAPGVPAGSQRAWCRLPARPDWADLGDLGRLLVEPSSGP